MRLFGDGRGVGGTSNTNKHHFFYLPIDHIRTHRQLINESRGTSFVTPYQQTKLNLRGNPLFFKLFEKLDVECLKVRQNDLFYQVYAERPDTTSMIGHRRP